LLFAWYDREVRSPSQPGVLTALRTSVLIALACLTAMTLMTALWLGWLFAAHVLGNVVVD
jgi:hypothetical protein